MDMTLPDIAALRTRAHALGKSRHSIGEILVEGGYLDDAAAARIAQAQLEQGLRFGEAAVQLKLLTLADIEYALAQQFEYPYLDAGDGSVAASVVSALRPFGPLAEQMRSLRTALLQRLAGQPSVARSVAVVSAMSGEGRSFIAANLAVALSQMGERTLLVDADLRQPRQHALFNLPGRLGLSNMLLGRAGPECIAKVPHFFDLSVLTAGSTPPNPQELLTRARLATLLGEAVEAFDVVILDTPAASLSADAQIVASRTGAGILVTRAGRTDARVLARTCRSLRDGGANLVGTVLNDA
jgi:protein-tyrosine kinase